MNKFQKAGLAVVAASGMAFAQGSLWGPSTTDFPSLQVRNDDVIACWAANPPDENYASKCYSESGGWWFGYTNNKTAQEKVEVKLGSSYTAFADGVSLTDATDGTSLITDALDVKLAVTTDENYPGAGIGFNHKQDGTRWNGGTKTLDISSHPGYCLTYTLDGDPMEFVLGWDESGTDDARNDVWKAPIQPTSSKATLNLSWDKFSQQGYAKPPWAISVAKEEAVSVKIRYNGEGAGTFKLYQLGWSGECTGGGAVPIVNKVGSGSNFAINLAGRSLSLSGFSKTVTVQVLNLNGAIVATQTMQSAGNMNLSNLPTGIYMVRVPALGYVSKVMLK